MSMLDCSESVGNRFAVWRNHRFRDLHGILYTQNEPFCVSFRANSCTRYHTLVVHQAEEKDQINALEKELKPMAQNRAHLKERLQNMASENEHSAAQTASSECNSFDLPSSIPSVHYSD